MTGLAVAFRRHSAWRLLTWALTLLAPGVAAATWVVYPGQSLAQTLARAADGDRVELFKGEYRGDVAVITQRRLTLRGVGGRPVLDAAGRSAEGKAILVVRDGDIRIENIEFRGARVPDGNGAGIRFERGHLQVAGCAFFDNQNGILSANFDDAVLEVSDSEFGQAPPHTPLPHLIYVGRIARFALSGSRFSGGRDGHLVKSRARVNDIRYNRLVDGAAGRAAYELEFPNGGLAWVVGNVIGQGPATSNPVIVSFGAEGSDGREQGLFMAANTIVNVGWRPAIFVHVDERRIGGRVPQRYVDNLAVGLGVGELGLADARQGNFTVPPFMLQDPDLGLYALAPGSWLRGRGVDPGQAQGASLRPTAEFVAPAGTRAIAPPSLWSPGAVQD